MSELEAQGSQSQCKGFPDWFRSRVGYNNSNVGIYLNYDSIAY